MIFTEKNVGFNNAQVVILPLPYDRTGSYRRGANRGPKAILDASQELELYDREMDLIPADVGIFTLSPPELSATPELMVDEVYNITKGLIEKGKFVVSLGGDHTVTIGIARAYKELHPDADFLVLDAHSDLRDEYTGSRFSHACMSRRLLEMGKVKIVGVRNISKEEIDYLRVASPSCEIVYMEDIIVNDRWMNDVIRGLSDSIYLSIDLDVLDSGIMPSVQTPQPGGFSWYEILGFLKTVMRERNVVGFDVVELSPILGDLAPDFLAAKLVYKMIGYKGLRKNTQRPLILRELKSSFSKLSKKT